MKRFTMFLLAVAISFATAQAPATPRATSTNLLFQLLGTANTIEIAVPAEAQHLYLTGMLNGEAVLTHDRSLTERRGGVLNAVVTAGALGNANGCPQLLFAHSSLEDASGNEFAAGTTSTCREQAGDATVRRAHLLPSLNMRGTRELPLNAWLALEAVRTGRASDASREDLESLDDVVVFYLYLSTSAESSPPAAPTFTTLREISAAFSQTGTE